MATYKTPGVYVEEISKFPPSVAQVETAIPAFIGYTEKAEKEVADDLKLVPKRIKSLLEYETYFGGPDKESGIDVTVSGDKIIVTNTNPSDYLMYYSMQMYFANGGGPCYVTSVGNYVNTIAFGDLEDGLAAIRKEDEPTLLLFPDAKKLSSSDFYALYDQALAQCNELQDRFTIIDTHTCTDLEADMIAFRNGIRSEKDYVKYGAVYYPYLETILDFAYDATDVSVQDASSESSSDVATTIKDSIDVSDLNAILTDIIATRDLITAGSTPVSDALLSDVRGQAQSIIDFLQSTYASLSSIAEIGKSDGAATEAGVLDTWLSGTLDTMITSLEAIQTTLNSTTSKNTVINNLQENSSNIFDILGGDNTATTAGDFDFALTDLPAILSVETAAVVASLALNGTSNITTLQELETADNALYNKIKAAISNSPVTLPPSSAMAGIYARTDANVGVWKAPANVNVSYVQRPLIQISSEEQADMNVTTTGKSVNAIRSFIGKGTLVWGARTLAGNDNEWRYIPVRRFFNMVEESVNKASEQFVFESNDANTWVKMQAMIENFLNLQWKAGALAGSKPEQAYYVRVGLGSTMTAQDILEGRMIIEIGMAAVRPAEFIILRFSHKMQEA